MRIIKFPDERLKEIAQPITKFDDDLAALATSLYQTMKKAVGAGLAATQVGVLKKIFVIDDGVIAGHLYICNPTWKSIEKTDKYTASEGCLSFPGMVFEVERFQKISVQFQDTSGRIHSMELSGFAAQVFQHESEHLDGILLIDHVV